MNKATLTIVILSFNTKELTLRAVRSCLSAFEDLKVIVVDNNSTDGSALAVQKEFWKETRVEVVGRDVNDGFAAGNNVALAKVGTPYVMLLNSDAYFSSHADMGVLISYMDEHPDVGVVTPHVLLGVGKTDPASHRGFPTPWNAISYFSGLEKISGILPIFGGYHQTWKNLSEVHEIDACTGAAMLIRTQAMKQVGFLDEQFFMYGEDLDWCYRFKEKGWKIIFHPGVVVHHDKHTSGIKKTKKAGFTPETSEIQLKSRGAFYEAMRLFYNKHYKGIYPAWVRHTMFAGIEIVRKLKGH